MTHGLRKDCLGVVVVVVVAVVAAAAAAAAAAAINEMNWVSDDDNNLKYPATLGLTPLKPWSFKGYGLRC